MRERQLEDANLQFGLFLAAARQQGGNVGLRQAVADGDAQITLIALRRRLCGTHRLLHGGQHAPALTEEHLTGPGQSRLVRAAVEQLHAERGFEIAHCARHRRLFYAKALGRSREMQFFRDRNEIAQ